MNIESKENYILIHCGKQMDINTVLEQRSLLLDVLKLKKNIHISANALSKIDTSGLQLLLNFCRTAKVHGIPLKWLGVSRSLQNAAATIGIQVLLGIKSEEPT